MVFDDMIPDLINNKRLNSVVTEIFILFYFIIIF